MKWRVEWNQLDKRFVQKLKIFQVWETKILFQFAKDHNAMVASIPSDVGNTCAKPRKIRSFKKTFWISFWMIIYWGLIRIFFFKLYLQKKDLSLWSVGRNMGSHPEKQDWNASLVGHGRWQWWWHWKYQIANDGYTRFHAL